MTTAARIDRQTFLSRVTQSGLVSLETLQQLAPLFSTADRGKVIARTLIDRGLLTRFQAERLLAGRTDGFFLGQYKILDEIGRGGMGKVFKAEHLTMGRVVALKVLTSRLTQTDRARSLFQREVKAAGKLHHPNIVAAFDANQIGDRFFLVLEFVDGPNLHDFVKERGPLPVTQACEFIRQVAEGLQYAHDLGMVHRDIKPSNMLVQSNSSRATPTAQIVKILDFGLARLHAPEEGQYQGKDSILTAQATVMGTPDYLAPEQARNLHKVDGRADLYALGCSFYYLLTGQVPFPGGTQLEKLVRHGTEDAKPIEQIRADVPPQIGLILRTLMAKDPAQRFQSARQLADVLYPWTQQSTGNWLRIELPDPNTGISGALSGSGIQQAPQLPANVPLPLVQPIVVPIPQSVPADSPWSNLLDDENTDLETTRPLHDALTAEAPSQRSWINSRPPSNRKLLLGLGLLAAGLVGGLILLRSFL